MSHAEKMELAIKRANLGDAFLAQLGDIKKLIITMLAATGVLIAIASTGYGLVAEILAGLIAAYALGMGVRQLYYGIKDLVDFYNLAKYAVAEKELDLAGKKFADAIAKITIAKITILLSTLGVRSTGAKIKQRIAKAKSQVAKAGDSLYTFTKSAGKHYDEIIKHGPNAGQLARPYMRSPLTIKEIMATGKGVPDATAKGALNFNVPGTFRGSKGTWELVIDPKKNFIYHFNFVK